MHLSEELLSGLMDAMFREFALDIIQDTGPQKINNSFLRRHNRGRCIVRATLCFTFNKHIVYIIFERCLTACRLPEIFEKTNLFRN